MLMRNLRKMQLVSVLRMRVLSPEHVGLSYRKQNRIEGQQGGIHSILPDNMNNAWTKVEDPLNGHFPHSLTLLSL